MTNEVSNILHKSSHTPNLVESDDGKKIVTKIFTKLLNSENNRRHSR